MTTFRRGMTILARQHLREEILTWEVERARTRASEKNLTGACRDAMLVMSVDPAKARGLHAGCKAEEYGGVGCLCLCHDEVTGEVITGTMTVR
jgi:hypothetical protein